MPYQHVREPLTAEESDRLSNACETPAERPGLEKALADVQSGDQFAVWKLDRLGRSLSSRRSPT